MKEINHITAFLTVYSNQSGAEEKCCLKKFVFVTSKLRRAEPQSPPPPHDYIHERLCSRLIWNLDLNRTAR